MHIIAMFSFLAVIVPLTTLAVSRVQTFLADASATPLELVTMPVVMVGGAIVSAVLFTWFVAKDRSKHIKRLDSLERSRRRTDKMFALIAQKLEIPARDVMEILSDELDDDSE